MLVLGERVVADCSGAVADCDERDLAREIHEAFVDEWLAAQPLPGIARVPRAEHGRLALAVVAEPPRLQDSRRTERSIARVRSASESTAANGATGMPRRWKRRFSKSRSCATSSARGGGQTGRDLRDCARRGDRHVLPVERDDVDAACEAGEFLSVVELAGDDLGDGRARNVGAPVVHRELDAERNAGKSHHPAELAGADDADAHGQPQPAAGSGFARTSAVCRSRNAASASLNGGWRPARMAVARSAALRAPGSPIATVATGNARRHLRDREQRIEAVQRFRLDRHADHRQQCL